MKATGIVRRVEARVIITQKSLKHWAFEQFLKKNFWQKLAYFDLYIEKVEWNHSAELICFCLLLPFGVDMLSQ